MQSTAMQITTSKGSSTETTTTTTTPAPSPTKSTKPIPFLYRLYFLYLEPLFAINGVRLAAFQGSYYLRIISPPNYPHPATGPTPDETALLIQIASLYLLFAFNEGIILRHVGQERQDIWRLIAIGCMLSDVGHLWALWKLAVSVKATDIFLDPRLWSRWEEWGNLGVTWFGLILRSAFMLRVGL